MRREQDQDEGTFLDPPCVGFEEHQHDLHAFQWSEGIRWYIYIWEYIYICIFTIQSLLNSTNSKQFIPRKLFLNSDVGCTVFYEDYFTFLSFPTKKPKKERKKQGMNSDWVGMSWSWVWNPAYCWKCVIRRAPEGFKLWRSLAGELYWPLTSRCHCHLGQTQLVHLSLSLGTDTVGIEWSCLFGTGSIASSVRIVL